MRVSRRALAVSTLALLVVARLCTAPVFAQAPDGIIRGEVTDVSGGVLPGVTVVATSADGRVLATTVTDSVGRYATKGVPAGPVRLEFKLDGFETSSVALVVENNAEALVVERLKLAHMTEEVVVYGRVPPDPPPPPPPPLPRYEPPPPPVVIPVPPQELESVCRPAKAGAMGQLFGTIRAHRYASERTLYSKGDELLIDGGTLNGIEVGRNFVVRRFYRANSRAAQVGEFGEHTAGLVQIVSAAERSATAVVVHLCNEVMQGDLVASFTPEPVHVPDVPGTPAYDDAARILFPDAGHMLGVARRLMVIDRGSERGIKAGQRLTLFRRRPDGTAPAVIGEAVVISVRGNSATVRVLAATDAIESGDWAAPQRP